eukprot:7336698-Pyramimonas_sp.AAC.1
MVFTHVAVARATRPCHGKDASPNADGMRLVFQMVFSQPRPAQLLELSPNTQALIPSQREKPGMSNEAGAGGKSEEERQRKKCGDDDDKESDVGEHVQDEEDDTRI